MFWITHTSPSVAYSLHFHLYFELPILPLVWRIHYTSTCMVNYPQFPGVVYSSHFYLCDELPILPPGVAYTFCTFWITYTSPSVAYSLHLHLCFELLILSLVSCILYTFTCVLNNPCFPWCGVFSTLSCVLNYPCFPWCGVFSTHSPVFWITHASPGVAYSLHFHLCFESPILPLVLRILYTFTCGLNNSYFPWCRVFSTLSPVFWITCTHASPGVAYSLHFHLCFE